MNNRKDKKVQVYKTLVEANGTRETRYRQYVYDENTYVSGGLWANVRGLTSSEKVSHGLAFSSDYIQLVMNRNSRIDDTCKIIFRDEIYEIESIDPMDFRIIDIKIKAKKSEDTLSYAGDRYYEQV